MYQWLLLIIVLNTSFSYSDNDVSIISSVNFISVNTANPIITQTSTQSPWYLLATTAAVKSSTTATKSPTKQTTPILSPSHALPLKPTVLAKEPYNRKWFTQGLYKDGESFYISSGLYNKSVLIFLSPSKNLRYFLPPHYFAEGLTVIDDKLFLLTWKEETLLVFDKNTLTPIKKLSYTGEGWGLTHNKKSFIMSNGTNTLKFMDKDSFEVQHTLTINKLDNINELEYVDGVIWANRWYDEKIYAIDSVKGCVLTSIDLTTLRLASITPDKKNIANGIAYDKDKNGLWVTGKYWNHRFLIALPPLDKTSCSFK